MPPPDRWEAYTALGKVIPKTRIIAFKVPLKDQLLHEVPEEDQFSPKILIKKLEEQGLKLGLIIDLTFTHKYYDRQEFLKSDVLHKKIFVKGDVIPSDKVFLEFADAVKGCNEEDSVIGVHCTHGINRTGYLVCRYMIEELNIDPEEAISLFNEARGHCIERVNYLEDLRTRQQGQSRLAYSQSLSEEADGRDNKKKKERWRHHREDHPGWRKRQNGDSFMGNGQQRHEPYQAPDFQGLGPANDLDGGYGDYRPDRQEQSRYQQAGWGNPNPRRGHSNHYDNPGGHIYGPPPNHYDSSSYRGMSWQDSRPYGPGYDRGMSDHYDRQEQSRYQQAGWGNPNPRHSRGRGDYYRGNHGGGRYQSRYNGPRGGQGHSSSRWGQGSQHKDVRSEQDDHNRSQSNDFHSSSHRDI